MAKSIEKITARRLRLEGKSLKAIADKLHVSKSSASLWCKDIGLSEKQIEILQANMAQGSYVGRLKWGKIQREKKQNKITECNKIGEEEFKHLSKQDIFMLGMGLFLGEGTKGGSRVRFTNADPVIIKIFIVWLKRIFGVTNKDIYYRVMINEIHKYREKKVREAWSEILNVPLNQFQKTVFIKAKNKKIYENMEVYLGTMALTVLKSSWLQYKILGLVHGIMYKYSDKLPA